MHFAVRNHFCSFSFQFIAPLNLCSIYLKFIWALAKLSEHMHKKFEVNWTKIKGGCQSERKVSQLNSYSKMPLALLDFPVSQLPITKWGFSKWGLQRTLGIASLDLT